MQSFGIEYAETNYDSYAYCYPNLSKWGDCANFVSQCILASGVHFQNDWFVYRRGTKLDEINKGDTSTLNSNWLLNDPSPWISAKYFAKYWRKNLKNYCYKGSEIANNPSLAWNLNIGPGDVVQYAKAGVFGAVGDAEHTMYITGTQNQNYLVTYHTSNKKNVDLTSICKSLPNYYFIFYEVV